ncbi:hypothetical protein NUW54_g5039 [Trametes sanguinea]|nr:hypothetical protein NUW54_g5039 [Trametes sanguinea]
MQFSTVVKLALVAAHVGVAMATPTAFKSRQLDIFCTSNADCSTGEECVDLLGSLGLPGVLEVRSISPVVVARAFLIKRCSVHRSVSLTALTLETSPKRVMPDHPPGIRPGQQPSCVMQSRTTLRVSSDSAQGDGIVAEGDRLADTDSERLTHYAGDWPSIARGWARRHAMDYGTMGRPLVLALLESMNVPDVIVHSSVPAPHSNAKRTTSNQLDPTPDGLSMRRTMSTHGFQTTYHQVAACLVSRFSMAHPIE